MHLMRRRSATSRPTDRSRHGYYIRSSCRSTCSLPASSLLGDRCIVGSYVAAARSHACRHGYV
uniref:Uncharacterized protein n=1 Tax=Setaria italica TaxID=4555 RepID=K3YXI1_SETIT